MGEKIKKAQEAVWYNTDCKLLTKEEYEELCKYKALYLDLKGSLEGIVKTSSKAHNTWTFRRNWLDYMVIDITHIIMWGYINLSLIFSDICTNIHSKNKVWL